jgi:hypothetical protein
MLDSIPKENPSTLYLIISKYVEEIIDVDAMDEY